MEGELRVLTSFIAGGRDLLCPRNTGDTQWLCSTVHVPSTVQLLQLHWWVSLHLLQPRQLQHPSLILTSASGTSCLVFLIGICLLSIGSHQNYLVFSLYHLLKHQFPAHVLFLGRTGGWGRVSNPGNGSLLFSVHHWAQCHLYALSRGLPYVCHHGLPLSHHLGWMVPSLVALRLAS